MKKKKGCLRIFLISFALFLGICGILIWGIATPYYSLSVSPDGETLVITTHFSVSMYNIENGRMLHRQYGKPYGEQYYDGHFSYIAWSPDGSCLAVGKLYNGIWIWNTENWKLITEIDGEQKTWREPSFAWSPDGQQLVLGRSNGEVWLWNKQENVWKIKAKDVDNLHSITWTENGKLLALQGKEIYDIETGEFISNLDHYISGSGKVSWSPDASQVYVFFDLGGGVMDVATNKYEFGSGWNAEFAWSESGQHFASVSENSNEIFVWDTLNKEIVRREKQGDIIYALAWTPENELLALGRRGLITMVWNTNTDEVIKRMFVAPNLLAWIESL